MKSWSLERLEFLLKHVGEFVDDQAKEFRERARDFVPQSGLDQVQALVDGNPLDPEMPVRVLERLTPFFDAGLLVQNEFNDTTINWWVTHVIWRGSQFHLDVHDQVRANHLLNVMSPVRVQRAPAPKILQSLKMEFLAPPDSFGYLVQPTPTLAYILISRLPEPWAVDHVAQTQRLLNKCFVY